MTKFRRTNKNKQSKNKNKTRKYLGGAAAVVAPPETEKINLISILKYMTPFEDKYVTDTNNFLNKIYEKGKEVTFDDLYYNLTGTGIQNENRTIVKNYLEILKKLFKYHRESLQNINMKLQIKSKKI